MGVLHLAPREGVNVAVWKKTGENTLVLVGSPTEHKDRPIQGRRRSSLGPEKKKLVPVRAKMPNTTSIREIKPGVCRVVFVDQTDVGGQVSVAIMNRALHRNIALTFRIRERFQALRGLSEWREEDGEATAEILVARTEAEKHHEKGVTRVEARVREVMEKQKGLRELGEKHEWFAALLTKLVANKLRPAGDCKTKLCNISLRQANMIGGGLACSVRARAAAAPAPLRPPHSSLSRSHADCG